MPKRNLIWTAAIVAAGVATVLLTRREPSGGDPELEQFRPVVRAYRILTDSAYRPLDESDLRRGAVRGMVEQLDEFSSYVPPDRIEGFLARLDGRVSCVGLLVDVNDGVAEVIGALPGSPAHHAGIAPGTRLTAVDGRDAADYSAEELRLLLEGPGTGKVALAVVDPQGGRHVYKLRRQPFDLEPVVGLGRTAKGRWEHFLDPDDRIAYLRVREFVPGTPERLQQGLREVAGAAGIVLDLRDNPGGRLEVGYAVANLFLRKGVILTQVDRRGVRQSFLARSEGTHPDVPMAVLVNGQTASAAELVAGALRLHDRAVLVGTRTRGKGLVQSMIALPDDLGQVNLTTGEFLVGEDEPVARREGETTWGVEPHRKIALTPHQERQRRLRWACAEAACAGPAPAPEGPATAPTTWPATRPADEPPEADPQLAEAVQLLETPRDYEALLTQAAAERADRARLRPATGAARAGAGLDGGAHHDAKQDE